jgi:hypothetical protein
MFDRNIVNMTKRIFGLIFHIGFIVSPIITSWSRSEEVALSLFCTCSCLSSLDLTIDALGREKVAEDHCLSFVF